MFKSATFLKLFMLATALICLSSKVVFADTLSIKNDAPVTYIVKKGDTLWDISNIFLEQPWLWPKLWRTNTQIENPHLIYPGDRLNLTFNAAGEPVLEIVRNKGAVVLTPNSRRNVKPTPIETLPWSELGKYIRQDGLMPVSDYNKLPSLLGDQMGTPVFIERDYILTHNLPDTTSHYQVVRKVREVVDSSGKSVGLQVNYLSDAHVTDALTDERQLVRLSNSNIEARQGDKVMPAIELDKSDLILTSATAETGEIIQNLSGNVIISQRDVVIVNLGEQDVKPGMVFGIYQRGPDVLAYDKPKYKKEGQFNLIDSLSFAEHVEQPALKVGELIIVRTFDNASYGWVTKAETWLKGGELIANP